VGAARFAAACLAASVFAACGLAVNGLETDGDGGGLDHVDGTADVSQSDAAPDVSSSGADTSTGPEAASSDTGSSGDVVLIEAAPVDGCVATGAENCTNGVDDDCNGLVDCADPACGTQGYACVAALPAKGWDFEAFSAASQAGCPATLTQKKVDVDPTNLGPATCGCTCGVGTQPSCDTGNIAASGGTDNTCGAGSGMLPANGGQCNTMTLPVGPYEKATPPGPTGGTCTANVSVTKPTTGATQGETCAGETAFGGGCSGTDVCALVPTGYTACLHHGGANMMCPVGYATSHAVGTLQDTRGCGNCMCAPPTATCSGNWNFFTAAGCTGAVTLSVTANGQCNATGNQNPAAMFQSNQLVATPNNTACAMPAAPMPTGTVTLTGADTLCCE
jgi:hypothetical protein